MRRRTPRTAPPYTCRTSASASGCSAGAVAEPKAEDSHVHSVVMPQMGESIAEGTIVRWIKKVGDAVDRDEPLFEISTDKVDAEIPSPVAGVVTEIRERGRDGSGQRRCRRDRCGGFDGDFRGAACGRIEGRDQSRSGAASSRATRPSPQADGSPTTAAPASAAPGLKTGPTGPDTSVGPAFRSAEGP